MTSLTETLNRNPNSAIPGANAPVWTRVQPKSRGFQEVWYLKLNERSGKHALWLRFTVLVSKNGFHKIAEAWAIFFQRENQEITKSAAKQTFPVASFESNNDSIQIGGCVLEPDATRGSIQSKGRSIQWDLSLQNLQEQPINLLPSGLKKLGIVKNNVWTVSENLAVSGSVIVDGVPFEFLDASGMQGHIYGPQNGHSWLWGHGNSFVNEKGESANFVFDGVTGRSRLPGSLSTPRMSSFYFLYQDRHYHFNSIRDALHLKSEYTFTEWNFQADRGDLSFRGKATAEYKDFAGITYEDTDGSLLYCAHSNLSNMTIHIYRRGKLETSFLANGTAAFEIVSREKNPYVKLLI